MKASVAHTSWNSSAQLLRHPARKLVHVHPLWYAQETHTSRSSSAYIPTCVVISLPASYATSTEAASTESSAHTSHPMARRSLMRWSHPVLSREERKLDELQGEKRRKGGECRRRGRKGRGGEGRETEGRGREGRGREECGKEIHDWEAKRVSQGGEWSTCPLQVI